MGYLSERGERQLYFGIGLSDILSRIFFEPAEMISAIHFPRKACVSGEALCNHLFELRPVGKHQPSGSH